MLGNHEWIGRMGGYGIFVVSNLYYQPFPYLSEAKAWGSAHALSMVIWSNHQIVVGQCSDTIKTFDLYKLLMLSDVLMLHIQLSILLCCHSVLLMHVIHPFHPHKSKTNNSKHFILVATNWSADGLLVVIVY